MKSSTPLKRTQFKVTKRSPLRKRSLSSGLTIQVGDRKLELWSTSKADHEWFLYLKLRDKHCKRCGIDGNLTPSHFYGRSINALRFHEDNCDIFCIWCHEEWETEKKGAYKEWKIAQLGQERFDALVERSKTSIKQTEAIRNLMVYLQVGIRVQPSELLEINLD